MTGSGVGCQKVLRALLCAVCCDALCCAVGHAVPLWDELSVVCCAVLYCAVLHVLCCTCDVLCCTCMFCAVCCMDLELSLQSVHLPQAGAHCQATFGSAHANMRPSSTYPDAARLRPECPRHPALCFLTLAHFVYPYQFCSHTSTCPAAPPFAHALMPTPDNHLAYKLLDHS